MNRRAKALCKNVIPAIISNVAFFLFSIVDGIFVGHGVGTNALGAVNLVMPFIMVLDALIMITVVGGVTVTAIRIGRGDKEGANQAFMHSFVATVAITGTLGILGMLFSGPLARLLGATDVFYAYVKEYLFWYCLFTVPAGLFSFANSFGRNEGITVRVSAAGVFATVVNIVLDYIFVFPLGMGLKGAAIATGLSQIIGTALVIFHFFGRKNTLRFQRFQFDQALLKKIFLRGAPEGMNQFAAPVSIFFTNRMLLQYVDEVAVNAFSIIGYVSSFSVAIFFATAVGMQPLFGQCYGAKDEKGLRYYFKAGVCINFISSVLITILLFFSGGPVAAMFGAEPKTLANVVADMPRYAWGFIFMSLNTIISSYLYSTKRTKDALILNVARSFVLSTAVILLTPALFGGAAIWYTMGIYEMLAFVLALILYRRSEKNGITFR